MPEHRHTHTNIHTVTFIYIDVPLKTELSANGLHAAKFILYVARSSGSPLLSGLELTCI
jgi:hypothetical protein